MRVGGRGKLAWRRSFIIKRAKRLGKVVRREVGNEVGGCSPSREEEKARKRNLASREDKAMKSLAFRDDKVYVSRKCQFRS